jgi:hypothetical protein
MPGRDAPPPLPALDSILDSPSPEASPRLAASLIGLGVAFDLAFNGQQPGISIPLFVGLLALSLRSVARRSIETDLLLGTAVGVSCFCAVRASGGMIALDVLAVAGLLGLVATQDAGSIFSLSVPQLARRASAIPRRAIEMPHYLIPAIVRGRRWRRAGDRPYVRAVALAVPVLALFAALLASGDRVFARVLSRVLPDWKAEHLVSHVILIAIGTALVAILWRIAAGDSPDPAPRVPSDEPSRRPLSFTETATVLTAIVTLFAAFVVVQLAYLFGGKQRVLVTPGLTYAEYARSGFFQLSAVAALTAVVILGSWDLTRRDGETHDRWFRGLVSALIALTGVILASALTRLALYEGAFGFTINRFFGYVGIAVIGGMLVVLLVAIMTGRRDRVVAGALAVGLAALLTVNVMSPDRFVAERNVARFGAIGRIDAEYVASLGPDAVPVTVGLLRVLPPLEARTLTLTLCVRSGELSQDSGWRSYNTGRTAARNALVAAGITPASCDVAASLPS